MHQAPPVEYPLSNAKSLRTGVATAWAVVVAVDALWLLHAEWHDWRLWLGLALTVLAAASACGFGLARVDGALHWNGSGWSHREGATETPGLVTVHLDLQSVLLVFWTPASGKGVWLWLDCAAQPACWLPLRRAVFSTARSDQGARSGDRTDLVARA